MLISNKTNKVHSITRLRNLAQGCLFCQCFLKRFLAAMDLVMLGRLHVIGGPLSSFWGYQLEYFPR